MEDLNERQEKILKAIIDEFIETANPVGSETLEKKYNFGVSPATIRNEMVKLIDAGFLKKIHSSSGRVPTPMALKYYINSLMKKEELSLAEEVAVKERVWDYRTRFEKFIREATRELASRTKLISLATTDQGDIYTSGLGNLLELPEFFDIDLTKTILSYLEKFDYWQNLVEGAVDDLSSIHILFGDELGEEIFEPCGFIFADYKAGPRSGVIGVVGPVRVRYSKILPIVEYFGGLIGEVCQSW